MDFAFLVYQDLEGHKEHEGDKKEEAVMCEWSSPFLHLRKVDTFIISDDLDGPIQPSTKDKPKK